MTPGDGPRPTFFLPSCVLSRRLGAEVTLAVECFQHTGSFKFRAAYHVTSHVPATRLLTASSGNFGAALARACLLLNKRCVVVMPKTSSRTKIAAVRDSGGEVILIDVARESRAARLARLSAEDPAAYVASPYDDALVIAGNASLGREIAARRPAFDVVVAPVGGGGLMSGIIAGFKGRRPRPEFIGAEPALGNDAARSLRAGRLLANRREPATIADGARTLSLGRLNWAILRENVASIVEVSEQRIAQALRWLFEAHVQAEPTGALAVAAVAVRPKAFAGRRVCCVVSGGNVDAEVYRAILAGGTGSRPPFEKGLQRTTRATVNAKPRKNPKRSKATRP
jgi:threonine dehydratase